MVSIANRTYERAQKLAEEIGCRSIDWAARHSIMCDTLINCTSVGMHPNLDESPLHHSYLKPGLTVARQRAQQARQRAMLQPSDQE